MAEVKALFPIGKTQWSKWNDKQKTAFNEARAAGVPYADAIAEANHMKKGGILKTLEDVAEVAVQVSSTAAAVAPVVGIAKTLAKATKKKGK